MGYFTYIADQAFKEGKHDETLFYLGGPWSKPLVIESDEQRQRTYSKHLWMQRVFLSIIIFGQPFLFIVMPDMTGKVLGFVGYLAVLILVHWLIQRIVFRSELSELKRHPNRLPLKEFYGQMTEKHSKAGLVFGLIVCMLFIICSIWMVFTSGALSGQVIGIICIVLFCAFGVAWGFALKLKCKDSKDKNA